MKLRSIVSIIMSMTLVMLSLTSSIHAEETASNNTSDIIYYEDGSYLTIHELQITVESSVRATSTIINAKRPITYTNSSGELVWEYYLHATFSYVYGSSATCTIASYDYTIHKDSWSFSDGSTSRSGGTAYGYGTFKNKVLFITTKTVNIDTYLTCDIYGNIS